MSGATRTSIFFLALAAAPSLTAQQRPSGTVRPEAMIVPTVPDISRADLDTTVAPCHDFHRYATGGWYARVPRSEREETAHGPDQHRPAQVLRQLVERSPALAPITKDPTLRAVGYFYGSCLTDQSGTADSALGSPARASECFEATRRHLDRALFELLMEYVWPPAARAEVKRFWPNMQAAAIEVFQNSKALPDSSKQQLIDLSGQIRLYASEGDRPSRDSTTELWRPESASAARPARGPSDPPFTGPIGDTWVYRDYSNVTLSSTDFAANLKQLEAAPDTLLPPALPGKVERSRERRTHVPRVLMDVVLGDETFDAGVGNQEAAAPLGMLVPAVIHGQLDMGAWYGMIGPVEGHEMSHGTLRGGGQRTPLTALNDSVREAFANELFKGQLQHFSHPFDDSFGLLVAYGAFTKAMERRHWPSIEGFTPEQRFFLGVARGWRGGPITESPISNGQTRWQVMTNGTLSAMPAFAEAFSCKAGDPMAGGRIWYQEPWKGTPMTDERRRDTYWNYLMDTSQDMSSRLMAGLDLTREQMDSLKALRSTLRAPMTALVDSLSTVTDTAAGQRRILEAFARYYGDVRAILTPAQKVVFDPQARAWVQRQREAGLPVVVPGVN